MSYIVYKVVNGNKYAYEITSYWVSDLKQSRYKSIYLGKVDPVTNEIKKRKKIPKEQEKLILDFGDGYFLSEFIKKTELFEIMQSTLIDVMPNLIPLLIYRLCNISAMQNCETWLEGNYLRCIYNSKDLASQRISEIFTKLGSENIQRAFFAKYLASIGETNEAVIIDATSLPNQINIDFNAWGRSDGKIEKQFKFLCVVDQIKKIPLFYRFIPGNLPDVSSLQTTLNELKAMGVNNSFCLLDAGYVSESNIHELFNKNINFLTRLPAGRKIYKDLIINHIDTLLESNNIQFFNKRGCFIKEVDINLYGHSANAYIIVDPERRGKEQKDLLEKWSVDVKKKDQYKLSTCGVLILISSKKIDITKILAAYYDRQAIEQIFGFAKDDLGLLPIRNHNDATVRGYLFFQFLLLIIYIKLREKVHNKVTVEQLIMNLKKQKCKVFDASIIPSEAVKDISDAYKICNIIVPNFLGI